jgi:phosphoribosylglycinamide formyltransferase 1
MTVRIGVLASGRGTNLQALMDRIAVLGDASPMEIALVASNRADAPSLERARAESIPAAVFNPGDDGTELINLLVSHDVHLVVLAGYLKRIPPGVVREFHGRIVNVHPGLLPEFGGAGMYGAKVHQAVISSGAKITGVTVHLVDDEFDHGPVIAQWKVPVLDSDTPESLASRVLEVEHLVFPRAVEMIAALNDRNIFADF